MKKYQLIGTMILAVISIVIGVILVFNLLQPLTNAGLANQMNNSATGNWANYAGSANLVQTVPLFNALFVVIFMIAALFMVLRGSGIV